MVAQFDPPEIPLLSPRVVASTEPVLVYTDARGQLKKLRLTKVGLARLALSIAEAQATFAKRDINPAV